MVILLQEKYLLLLTEVGAKIPFKAGHCIALHCIKLHCIVLHCIALNCTALHCIALNCIVLHCIFALHYIALHCIFVQFRNHFLLYRLALRLQPRLSSKQPTSTAMELSFSTSGRIGLLCRFEHSCSGWTQQKRLISAEIKNNHFWKPAFYINWPYMHISTLINPTLHIS